MSDTFFYRPTAPKIPDGEKVDFDVSRLVFVKIKPDKVGTWSCFPQQPKA